LDKAKEVYQLLTDFYSQRDNTGKEMYPNAMERFEELVEELETGCTLQDAYERVMGREPAQASDEVTMEDTAPRSSKRRKTPQEEEEDMLNRKLRQILRS
jgi:arginyl-tRNA--protein-N-Asp/Glu arginylyltransferase